MPLVTASLVCVGVFSGKRDSYSSFLIIPPFLLPVSHWEASSFSGYSKTEATERTPGILKFFCSPGRLLTSILNSWGYRPVPQAWFKLLTVGVSLLSHLNGCRSFQISCFLLASAPTCSFTMLTLVGKRTDKKCGASFFYSAGCQLWKINEMSVCSVVLCS